MFNNRSVVPVCLNPGSFDFDQKMAVELGFPWVALHVTTKSFPSMKCCLAKGNTYGGSKEKES